MFWRIHDSNVGKINQAISNFEKLAFVSARRDEWNQFAREHFGKCLESNGEYFDKK